ncbi:hypothetical protein ACP275_09G055800 [Erythranthe tilingii]
MYIKLETTRLDYYRKNQSNLRYELYQGIMNSVLKGETRGSEVGKRVVLPASFIGEPRDMRRRYFDALTLVQRFGKPDLFITMTWPIPAILQDLKDQLFKKEIFGKVVAHVHVIEFQKRGLPHAHILVIMKFEYKITNEEQYPLLHALVRKHMMHGPCGEKNKRNSCMWVVPYNPYLLTRYNCHINVEIYSGVTPVKYLYKYIYKGHDRVVINISQNSEEQTIDEIKQFQDARWISAQEAVWRIFEFEMNEIYPPVIDLHLHLPNQQFVTYWANQNLESILRWDHVSKTMLTEYFSMCSKSEKARKLLYKEFPEHYVWDKKHKCWNERKKRDVIGRIHGANPMEEKRYYLRLLLNHVRDLASFQDLLSIDGIRCSNFKEASQKRGLLHSDQSIIECLNEAISFQMPRELRRLFAIILVYCAPTNVRNLWDTYIEAMSEDFKKQPGTSIQLQHTKTLESTKNKPADWSREIEEEFSLEIPMEDQEAETKLNEEQSKAFNTILDCVGKMKPAMFFIDGPGGSGQTFLYRALLAHLRSRKQIAIATATSGVAAAIMPRGRTAHSCFKIPIDATDSTECNISKQSGTADLFCKAKLLIWDEAPMAKRWAIENHFGGKVIVFRGDFRQVLPVVPRATIHQKIYASLPTDIEGNVKIPDDKIMNYDTEERSIQCLIAEIFPRLTNNAHSLGYMTSRAILAAKNEDVDKLNEKMISPPHKLLLKRNCPLILLRNLDPSNGLCNGTRMVCKDFKDNVLHAEIVFGQTIPNVGVYLPQSVFFHGQLYEVLLGGTSMSTTKVLIKPDTNNVRDRMTTKNVVYKELKVLVDTGASSKFPISKNGNFHFSGPAKPGNFPI